MNKNSERENIDFDEILLSKKDDLPFVIFQIHSVDDNFHLRKISQSCKNLLDLEKNQIIANDSIFFDRLSEFDRNELFFLLKKSKENKKVVNWEGQYFSKKWNDYKWINLRAALSFSEGYRFLWTGIMTNISHSKRLQNSLSEEKIGRHIAQKYSSENEKNLRGSTSLILRKVSREIIFAQELMQHAKNELINFEDKLKIFNLIDKILNGSVNSINDQFKKNTPKIINSGLIESLYWLCSQYEFKTGLPFEFHCKQSYVNISDDVVLLTYKIVDKCINVFVNDFNASSFDLFLFEKDFQILIDIAINHQSMPENTDLRIFTNGLTDIENLIEKINGSFNLAIIKAKGSLISLKIPSSQILI